MARTSNNLNQLALPLDLTPTMEWPKNYSKGLSDDLKWDSLIALDAETEGLVPYHHNRKLVSLAMSPYKGTAYATHILDGMKPEELALLKELLAREDIIIIGHNIKFDLNWIKVKLGIKPKAKVFDTMYAYYLLDENARSKRLETLAAKYTTLGNYKKDIPNIADIKRWAIDDVLIYNGKDADATRRLFDVFVPKLNKQKLLPLMETAMEVLPVLSDIETTGVYLDKKWAKRQQVKLFERLVSNRLKINDLAKAKIRPDSYKSLVYLLYTKMGLPIEFYTKKGLPSTDQSAIKRAIERVEPGSTNEHILRAIQEEKKDLKLLSTYYQPIEKWTAYDERVHTNYRFGKQEDDKGTGGTVTGRLSSDAPNLQQIPISSEVRGMFAATNDYLLFDGDYSQLELRVAAYLSKEPLMIQAFEEGLDIHTLVMADLKELPYDVVSNYLKTDEHFKIERVAIKRINFGILYGVQAKRLQKLLWLELGITWPLEKCKELINQWLNKYTRVKRWIKMQRYFAYHNKYVFMPLGQMRRLPDADFGTMDGERAMRQATNFPVQSFASWICLIGAMLLSKWIDSNNLNGRLLMLVHDSVNLEFPKQGLNPERMAKRIARIMEVDVVDYMKEVFNVNFNVPLQFKVKFGERWQ